MFVLRNYNCMLRKVFFLVVVFNNIVWFVNTAPRILNQVIQQGVEIGDHPEKKHITKPNKSLASRIKIPNSNVL